MSEPTVLTAVDNGVGTITLNRPQVRNALDQAMRTELARAIAQMRDDAGVHAVVLTGAGGAFCSGGDIRQMLQSGSSTSSWRERIRSLHRWLPELVNLEKPVIAAVDGPAFGAGLGLVLAADFVIATQRATFCAVFGRIGLIPDMGVMRLLPRVVGFQKAKELIFTTRVLNAAEAQAAGIVYQTVADAGALRGAARAFAERFAQASTIAIGMAKTALNQCFELDAHAMAEIEAYAQAICSDSDYHHDAVQRFRDKRPLRFNWEDDA